MYGYKNVYESYYEHKCSATTEKDVIYQDIWGKGVLPQLKRRWHDMFLLSYSDSRSKLYYMSSYAMMSARTAHFRNSMGYIHPFSKFRNIWDCLVLHLLILHMILFHFNTSIIHHTPLMLHYLVAAMEYVFILDIFISTRTGYAIEKQRQVIMKPSDIILHYLSSNACVDVMCAIPLQNLKFLRHGNVTDTTKNANLFVSTLKILSMVHIIRLFRVSEYWAKDRDTFRRTMAFRLLRIVLVGLVMIVQIETLTTALSVIHFVGNGVGTEVDSYLKTMLYFKYVELVGKESFFFFIMISRVFKSLFLFGYCLRPNTDIVDQFTAILTYCTAFVFHFWASVVVYHCVVRENALDDTLSTTWNQTLAVLRHRRLQDKVHTRVKQYFDFKLSQALVIEKRNRLFRALPSELRSEIKMTCYRRLVEKIPCFADWPPDIIAGIVELLYTEIYLEDDVLSSAWGQPEDLIIVEAGVVAMYSDQKELGHLVDGDHFGEHTISTDEYVPSPVLVTVTTTVVQVVDKPCFRKKMKRYPAKYLSEFEQNVVSKENYEALSSPYN